MPKKVTIKKCNFTVETDKAVKDVADAIRQQAHANLATAEALRTLAGRVWSSTAPVLNIEGDR